MRYVKFSLNPNKTMDNAFAELDRYDFEVGDFLEAELPDFAGLGYSPFTSDSA